MPTFFPLAIMSSNQERLDQDLLSDLVSSVFAVVTLVKRKKKHVALLQPRMSSSFNLFSKLDCAPIKDSLLLTHARMHDLTCENEVGGCRGAAGFGQWASNGHMGLSPSLHNNSAGPCGYIPALDIFSKNIPSLQPPSCKTHWNRFLSTSGTESNEAYKASQQYTPLMWLYHVEIVGSDNNGWPFLLHLSEKAVKKKKLIKSTNKGRRQ